MQDETSAALTYSAQPKLQTQVVSPLATQTDLALAYTPGIAEVCQLIQTDPQAMFTHTFRRHNLAVISDGSAVLGLGNIGHQASYPVMEGKAMLFKRFADIDAIPIVIDTQDTETFIDTVKHIADSFGAINLEDIAAPRCFTIEQRLKTELDIPVMHDDQHGTATVVLAAVLNALTLTNRNDRSVVRVVVSGAGAAATATIKLLMESGFHHILVTDSQGIIHAARHNLSPEKQWLAQHTNPEQKSGSLIEALNQSDVFIGLSRGNLLTAADITHMAQQSIVIAMANPVPEIMPEEAKRGGAAVVATGRSDQANQVNNALAFPGIFHGAMLARAQITHTMLVAAAEAILEYQRDALTPDNLMPHILDEKVHQFVAERVWAAAQS